MRVVSAALFVAYFCCSVALAMWPHVYDPGVQQPVYILPSAQYSTENYFAPDARQFTVAGSVDGLIERNCQQSLAQFSQFVDVGGLLITVWTPTVAGNLAADIQLTMAAELCLQHMYFRSAIPDKPPLRVYSTSQDTDNRAVPVMQRLFTFALQEGRHDIATIFSRAVIPLLLTTQAMNDFFSSHIYALVAAPIYWVVINSRALTENAIRDALPLPDSKILLTQLWYKSHITQTEFVGEVFRYYYRMGTHSTRDDSIAGFGRNLDVLVHEMSINRPRLRDYIWDCAVRLTSQPLLHRFIATLARQSRTKVKMIILANKVGANTLYVVVQSLASFPDTFGQAVCALLHLETIDKARHIFLFPLCPDRILHTAPRESLRMLPMPVIESLMPASGASPEIKDWFCERLIDVGATFQLREQVKNCLNKFDTAFCGSYGIMARVAKQIRTCARNIDPWTGPAPTHPFTVDLKSFWRNVGHTINALIAQGRHSRR